MSEQAVDLVERVVFVATPTDGVLLDPAADLVEDLAAEPPLYTVICDEPFMPVSSS
jgi:hypothetical protein